MIEVFSSRDAASAAAAETIAASLRQTLTEQSDASLVVSGGSTPKDCLQQLAVSTLDWSKVTVTLTDERCVPVEDSLSNEAMVRRTLLQARAKQAKFVSLMDANLPDLTLPSAITLLGMGEDGHIASLFPDLPQLDKLLDTTQPAGVFEVTTAASPVARRSMNLSLLLNTDSILLLAFGDSKRNVLEQETHLPVHSVASQSQTPVAVYWAP